MLSSSHLVYHQTLGVPGPYLNVFEGYGKAWSVGEYVCLLSQRDQILHVALDTVMVDETLSRLYKNSV